MIDNAGAPEITLQDLQNGVAHNGCVISLSNISPGRAIYIPFEISTPRKRAEARRHKGGAPKPILGDYRLAMVAKGLIYPP